ncbi:hypothetical protein [Nitrosovibrio sp. Nv6]|uniref:hypothetical protein n=1 Tax=Nitrosovibrio sp. Nv6 TaxID=1855340 RepID=UPI0008D3F843|nr:hypothetical protein [Nitrosovibrio sp. Nv6]SEP25337.1 hypothetical protein SAMN05216316_2163 [Nitrosovibrio sp. Nv6]
MKKDTEAQRRHKIYLRTKNALRDKHQDDYALMLERHAQELDTLWANYNLAVKKLASDHNKKTAKARTIKSTSVRIRKKGMLSVEPEEKVIH